MSFLNTQKIQCPYCWEMIELVVDASGGSQSYVEDCEVCCRPIAIHMNVDNDGQANLETRIEGE